MKTTNQFIESQQELAREVLIQADVSGFSTLSEEEVNEVIQQIIQNTGEEFLRLAEGERKEYGELHNYSGGREDNHTHDTHNAVIDTMQKHITSVTGVDLITLKRASDARSIEEKVRLALGELGATWEDPELVIQNIIDIINEAK